MGSKSPRRHCKGKGGSLIKEDYYSDYLTSDHWKKTRKDALQRAGHKCQKCGTGGTLDVHHLVYRRYREKPEDLIAVCPKCHDELHRGEHKDADEMLDYQGGVL